MVEEVAITLLHLPSALEMFEHPEAPGDWVLFYCFYFSFRCPSEWNRCPARLLDWKAAVPPVVFGSSPPSPQAVGPTTGGPCSLWHPTSAAWGQALLAVGRSHHSLVTRPLWCPLDGMSVTHGGKSISHVWGESGGMFAGGIVTFICRWGQTGSGLQFLITFYWLNVQWSTETTVEFSCEYLMRII